MFKNIDQKAESIYTMFKVSRIMSHYRYRTYSFVVGRFAQLVCVTVAVVAVTFMDRLSRR